MTQELTVALQNRKRSKGRHPLLKIGTLASNIFLYLKQTPGASIPEIASTLKETTQQINGILQRMKHHGLVLSSPQNKGNRIRTVYYPVTENETGFARDKVAFEVTILVNEYGEYSASVEVVNQSPFAKEGNPKSVHKATFYVAVPKPNESYRTRQAFHTDVVRDHGLLLDLTEGK